MMVTVNRSKAGVYQVGNDGFNFENNDIGDSPITGWSNTIGATQIIVGENEGHYRVMAAIGELLGNSVYHDFTAGAQESGTVELYFYVVQLGDDDDFFYLRNGATNVCGLKIDTDGNLYAVHGGGATSLVAWVAETWYHVSIRFERTVGGYQGLAQNNFKIFINGTEYGDYALINNNDVSRIAFDIDSGLFLAGTYHFDAIAWDWDAAYDIGDNLTLEDDATITNSLISQLKIHYPTTLEPTNVKFDGKTYEKYYPVCVAKINPSEDVFLGCTIKITDNLTSGGATASSVIFKGEVVKKLTKETSGFIPSYLIFSNAKEMDSIKPEGSYTKDTDGYISDILTNLCDKLTEGTLSDGADLGTFTAAGDKSFTLITKQCARFDGYIAYIDSSAGADNADLMYNDGSTDTGVDIDESSSTLRGLRSFSQLDEHINKVIVRGGIQADGTRAEGTASDTTSQGLYGIVPTYDTDTNLNTDALCASKAAQILADNEFGNRRVVVGYKDATKGMLQPGETITFDWDAAVHDIGFSIEQEQYIIARNIYDPLVGINILTLFSSIYYPPISDGELLQETSHVALQNSDNIATNNTSMEAYLAIGSANARWKSLSLHSADVATSMTTRTYFSNSGANDFYMLYNIDLPPKLGTLDLYISELQILIHTSDATDYVDRIRFVVYTDEDTGTTPVDLDHDTLNGTAKGTYTYDSGDDGDLPYNCGSGVFMGILINIIATTQDEIKLTGFRVKYYYA